VGIETVAEEELMTEEKSLTIADALVEGQVVEAIRNLRRGKTPVKHVKQRPARGGGTVNYVETYYVVDQLNKLFSFRWDFEVLEHVVDNSSCIVKGKLTCHTPSGDIVKHQFGEADRHSGVPVGDTLKAATSDCLKKCASLIGIALDVYWGKELEFFAEEGEVQVKMTTSDAARAFNKFVESRHLPYSKVFSILGIKSMAEIANFKEAYNKLKEALDGEDKAH
jgi:hypothetical protein